MVMLAPTILLALNPWMRTHPTICLITSSTSAATLAVQGPALQPEGANAEDEVQDAKDGIRDRRVSQGPSAVSDRRSRHTGDYKSRP